MTLRIGSLCSGYGGLDLAVSSTLDAEPAWYAQHDPDDKHQYAAQIIAARFPGVPNHGDITAIDFARAEPVDVLTAGFPCFPAETLILTKAGYRPIAEIEVGEEVLTHCGRWRAVTSFMARDNAQLWRIKAGYPITTTAEHPFFAIHQGRHWDNAVRQYRRTFTDPEWVEASELQPWKHRIGHVLPPVSQPDRGNPDWWWLVGRYLADGHRVRRLKTGSGNPVGGDQGRVVIAAGPGKDEDIRKRLSALGLHATEVRERSVIKFHIINQDFYTFLADFGHGAANKALTLEALALPGDLAEALLSGWLAGDGYEAKSGWVGTTVSKALALGVVLIAHRARSVLAAVSYSVPAAMTVIEGRTVKRQPIWRIAIPPTNRRGIVDGDCAWKFVTGSTSAGSTARVYNLSVADDESYIADGVIVHNCQDVSLAGKRAGLREGTRSGLWSHVARAIEALRPPLVLIENVRSLTSAWADSGVERCAWCLGDSGDEHSLRALGCVLGDLASLGFDASWQVVRASEVGAPHKRERAFILAWPAAHPAHVGRERDRPSRNGGGGSENGRRTAADATGDGRVERGSEPARLVGRPAADPGGGTPASDPGRDPRPQGDAHRATAARNRGTAADADGDAVREQPVSEPGGGGPAVAGLARVEWGTYEAAIRRWEAVLGRPAPGPVDDRGRLTVRFVEWMQGLPDGWVTDVPGIPRTAQLRALGNGVVPQQGAHALRLLLDDYDWATTVAELETPVDEPSDFGWPDTGHPDAYFGERAITRTVETAVPAGVWAGAL